MVQDFHKFHQMVDKSIKDMNINLRNQLEKINISSHQCYRDQIFSYEQQLKVIKDNIDAYIDTNSVNLINKQRKVKEFHNFELQLDAKQNHLDELTQKIKKCVKLNQIDEIVDSILKNINHQLDQNVYKFRNLCLTKNEIKFVPSNLIKYFKIVEDFGTAVELISVADELCGNRKLNKPKECIFWDELSNRMSERVLNNDFKFAIRFLTESYIPYGFIYTQLSGEKLPSELWPSLTWENVTKHILQDRVAVSHQNNKVNDTAVHLTFWKRIGINSFFTL